MNVSDLMSFDLNYYFEFIKNIATHTFLAFETKYTNQLQELWLSAFCKL